MSVHDQPAREPLLRPDHHDRIEACLEELRSAARVDDRSALHDAWDALENAVLGHIGAEEELILPPFADIYPEEAEAIRAEHDEIRGLLEDLAVSVDLKRLNAGTADELATRLQDHARREDGFLYPWAQRKLSAWPYFRDALLRPGITARTEAEREKKSP